MSIAYKLFKVYTKSPGKLFPLYVNANEEIPVGKWISAKCGEMTNNGKVKSKLGELCFRPGFHLSDIPLATHIGVKGNSGTIEFIKPDTIWCECEYSDKINYQVKANKNGINSHGNVIPKNAYLKEIPVNGFYRYKTNPQQLGTWIIAGEIKIIRVLSDTEVNKILQKNGMTPMPRFGGEFDSKKYGIRIG